MKLFTFYTTLLFSFLIASIASYGQFVPNGVIPEIGDVVQSITAEADRVVEGDDGNGALWDFSMMSPVPLTEATTVAYVSPDDTPHAAAFPNANLAARSSTTSGDIYSYYTKDGSRLRYLGNASLGILTFYDNPQLVLDEDLSAGTILGDGFSGQTDHPQNPLHTIGAQTFQVDAEGTLILPSGSYSNAVRMVQKIERIDSSGNATFTSVVRTNTTAYLWMIPGQADIVMAIVYVEGQSETTIPGNPTTITPIPQTKSVFYNPNPGTITATHEITGIDQYRIAPNPTRDEVRISMQVEKAQDVHLRLTDLLGRTVEQRVLSLRTGNEQQQLDLSKLPAGTYLLSIYNEEGMHTERVIKR